MTGRVDGLDSRSIITASDRVHPHPLHPRHSPHAPPDLRLGVDEEVRRDHDRLALVEPRQNLDELTANRPDEYFSGA